MHAPICLMTDFGWSGPYVGHVKARLWQEGHTGAVIDIMHDAPAFDPLSAAPLLAAHLPYIPENAVCMAVIDPGVGSARRAMAVQVGNRWLVGPDNGLLDQACATAQTDPLIAYTLEVPTQAAVTFHGRDIFAPAAARLAQQQKPLGTLFELPRPIKASAPETRIIYIDGYGNAMTNIPAHLLPAHDIPAQGLTINGTHITKAHTFSDVAPGTVFCYVNSIGLVEIAVNQGSATAQLGYHVGMTLAIPSLQA